MLRLVIRVASRQAELVLAELLELAPGGVEEVDAGGGVVEYAIYGAPGEVPELPELTAAVKSALVEVYTQEVADDWDRRWREFHRPLVLQGRLCVRPPWEPPAGTPLDIVIDPGRAFGTGAHATTRLCLELLLDLAQRGGAGGDPTVQPIRARGESLTTTGRAPGAPRGQPRGALGELVDLGCGSGVLAITAAHVGFAPVQALDNDRASLAATAHNAQRNGACVEVQRHDLRSDPPAGARTVTANLLAPLLRTWASRLAEASSRPGRVIAGGLLTHETDEVAEVFAPLGLAETARREAGEWAALLLERPRS